MASLEEVIRHINDVPKSRFNRSLTEMSDSERLRLKLADTLMGGHLTKLKDWYLNLRSIANSNKPRYEKIEIILNAEENIENSYFLPGLGQLRYRFANWLLDGTLDKFSSWYNTLLDLSKIIEYYTLEEVYPDYDAPLVFGNS